VTTVLRSSAAAATAVVLSPMAMFEVALFPDLGRRYQTNWGTGGSDMEVFRAKRTFDAL
jgi:hypothetical protein